MGICQEIFQKDQGRTKNPLLRAGVELPKYNHDLPAFVVDWINPAGFVDGIFDGGIDRAELWFYMENGCIVRSNFNMTDQLLSGGKHCAQQSSLERRAVEDEVLIGSAEFANTDKLP